MKPRFRVIDTGVRGGTDNIAFDAALVELHKDGVIGDTMRFLRFRPTALVGRHQDLSREIHLDYCTAHGIDVARRITGGGALYMDEGQLGIELVFHRASLGIASLSDLASAICESLACGLNRLGIAARFRPRNDIEIDGRKIGGSGGFFDGDTLFYQCTLLVDTDIARMLAALNIPREKLEKRHLASVAQRVVTVKELLGSAPDDAAIKSGVIAGFAERLGIDPVWDAVSTEEEACAAQLRDQEIGTEAFIRCIDHPGTGPDILSGRHASPGGTIRVDIRREGASFDRFREVLITGDFFVTPPRLILDLEARLRGTPLADIKETVLQFFATSDGGTLSVAPEDFVTAINDALTQQTVTNYALHSVN